MTTSPDDLAFLGRMAVLYVEDDPSIRSITAEFLRRRVGRLLLAEDGREGLEVFRAERPDLLVTDIMMPRMDGLDLAEAARKEAPDLPVVVTTAFEQTSFLLRAISLGVDRYVVKPVEPELLEGALLHCARQARAEAETRERQRLERELLQARHHEALAILARGMAHDYNNLLQAIMSSIENAALHTQSGSPAQLILGLAHRYTGMAQHLGQQLLALGQMDERVDERGSLASVAVPAIQQALQGTPVRLVARLPEGLPDLAFNRNRLAQAFQILAANAADALPEGGELRLEATVLERRESADGIRPAALAIELRDTGPGIPEDLLPRIFEPYVSSKRQMSQKGRGLGLAICRSILLAHGGEIRAGNAPEGGALFRIELPPAPVPA